MRSHWLVEANAKKVLRLEHLFLSFGLTALPSVAAAHQ